MNAEWGRHTSPRKSGTWLVPFWLLLTLLGVLFVVSSWSWIPYVAVGTIVLAAVVWVLVSVLSPAKPNRLCPQCQKEGLVKIRRGELGVHCEHCDFRDEEMHVAYLDEW